jgi:hypothetical protein
MTSTLNRFGAEGWEVASMTAVPSMGVFTLCTKRALP